MLEIKKIWRERKKRFEITIWQILKTHKEDAVYSALNKRIKTRAQNAKLILKYRANQILKSISTQRSQFLLGKNDWFWICERKHVSLDHFVRSNSQEIARRESCIKNLRTQSEEVLLVPNGIIWVLIVRKIIIIRITKHIIIRKKRTTFVLFMNS
jgi:hypothetical protein